MLFSPRGRVVPASEIVERLNIDIPFIEYNIAALKDKLSRRHFALRKGRKGYYVQWQS